MAFSSTIAFLTWPASQAGTYWFHLKVEHTLFILKNCLMVSFFNRLDIESLHECFQHQKTLVSFYTKDNFTVRAP